MTTVYFVRHAEPDYKDHDDRTRSLTEKGKTDVKLVIQFFRDKDKKLMYLNYSKIY